MLQFQYFFQSIWEDAYWNKKISSAEFLFKHAFITATSCNTNAQVLCKGVDLFSLTANALFLPDCDFFCTCNFYTSFMYIQAAIKYLSRIRSENLPIFGFDFHVYLLLWITVFKSMLSAESLKRGFHLYHHTYIEHVPLKYTKNVLFPMFMPLHTDRKSTCYKTCKHHL